MAFKGGCIAARISLAFLCATGVMELYMSRTNLSIAIVAMVQIVTSETIERTTPQEPYCLRNDDKFILFDDHGIPNSTSNSEYTFISTSEISIVDSSQNTSPIKMTSTQRGNVLAAFFYAYSLTQILGGRLAELYGTKKVFGMAVLVDGIGNLLIPFASKTSPGLLFFIRFLMGLFQGTCYPALTSLVSRWIPPDEISRFMSFVYIANSFGTIFTLTISGIIISEIGWESVFYISGSLSFTWLIFWIFLMHDTPEEHPRISDKEKNYIREAKAAAKTTSKSKLKVPWLKMLSSIPLWAICFAHAGNMFGLNMFITQLPVYMSSIIGVNIRNNGALSSLPFLARFLGSNFFSWMSNYLKKKVTLHPKTWKIILTVIGCWGPAIAIVMVGYVGCSWLAALSLFIVGLAMNGANIDGYVTNIVEIAPNFAGTVMGLSGTVAFLYAMSAPVVIGALTPEETLNEWITVYWVGFASYVVTSLIYMIFLSTDAQPWNNVVEGEDDNKTEAATVGEEEWEEREKRTVKV